MYVIVFTYASAIHFFKIYLPLASLAVPLAITIFVIFIIHIFNILIRIKQKE